MTVFGPLTLRHEGGINREQFGKSSVRPITIETRGVQRYVRTEICQNPLSF